MLFALALLAEGCVTAPDDITGFADEAAVVYCARVGDAYATDEDCERDISQVALTIATGGHPDVCVDYSRAAASRCLHDLDTEPVETINAEWADSCREVCDLSMYVEE